MHDQFLLDINNPILKNHKAYGQELLPGLAYIDMLYQLFRENGYHYTQLELRNLSIYHPLIIESDTSIIISIQCSEIKDGQWHIIVEGQEQRGGILSVDKKRYVTAEMHQVTPRRFEEVLNLRKIKELTKNVVSLEEVYEQCRRHELIHTGFMKAEGLIYTEDTEILIDISLGEKALPTAKEFMFHPALIDGSGVGFGGAPFPILQESQRLFLPMFYESFYASDLLQKCCITRIKASSVKSKNELIYITMEFFNEFGKKVGELKNFTSKLVREAGLINPNRKEDKQLTSAPYPKNSIPQRDAANTAASVEVEDFLRELMAGRLGKTADQIENHIGYYEMGLDSPGLLEIVKGIEEKIGTTLSPTLLFEYTNIKELSVYLMENYASVFGQICKLTQDIECSSNVFTSESLLQKESIFSPSQASYLEMNSSIQENIAIIGMAGRFPGAGNLFEFWDNLKKGKDCISEIPKGRWDWHSLEKLKSPSGKELSRWGGFLDNPDCFDPQFFRISPREAEVMDPQERIFLETCWEAIEDAGYTPKTLVTPSGPNRRRNVGVYVGVMHKDYTLIGAEAVSRGKVLPLSLNYGSIANRVSYFCNFHGPSMAIDTLCSSSLTAVHLALESIRNGGCEVALAGGVNLSLHPNKYMTYGLADMHSSDGYCHTFGKDGDGYVSAEGVGTVLLKPLHKAIQDGDQIYGVIKGGSINHVGTVSGITVPSPVAQAELIVESLEKAKVDPRTISYVEAHGTGTSLGDPIEIQGLVKAFRQYTGDNQFCSIGSVKSNIGHAESAAGISGLIKVALQLHHKTLVSSLHAKEINPYIDFEQSPFYVQQETREWKQPSMIKEGQELSYPRRAGLSSFGAAGSNAHIILEEYIPKEQAVEIPTIKPVIVPLSAKNKERLKNYVKNLYEFLTGSSLEKNHKYDSKERQKNLHRILQKEIRKILAEIMHVEEEVLEVEHEWNEYGLEPIQIAKVMELIQEQFTIQTDVEEFNQSSSISSVVDYIIKNHLKEIENLNFLLSNSETQHQKETEGLKKSLLNREICLTDLAYTLQVGREAMEERIVFLVKDIEELIVKLKAYIEDTGAISDFWEGNIKHNKETIEFLTDQDSLELIHKWIEKENTKKIANLWVKGYSMDWELFYKEKRHQRISLPTYPFAKERYWITEVSENNIFEPIENIKIKINDFSDLSNENKDDFFSNMVDYIIKVLSNTLKLDPSKLDSNTSFDELGLDSIMITHISKTLESTFRQIPATIFFTYKNIHSLTQYFMQEHYEEVKLLFQEPNSEGVSQSETLESVHKINEVQGIRKINKTNIETSEEDEESQDWIAVIGMSGQYPEADNLQEFWGNLTHGKDSIVEIPKERWDYKKYQTSDNMPGKTGGMYSKWGGFLADVDKFDPSFFNISPIEARGMDPHERLFIQTVSACFEDAGYSKKLLENKNMGDGRAPVGVFAGVTFNNYQLYAIEEWEKGNLIPVISQIFSIANRVSYLFNLGGPSLSVDTACSSSLKAIHLACESIKRGECEMAIAGGVNLSLHPSKYMTLCSGQFASSDGRCRAFGENGDGYVPGEGVGAVLLKPLNKAIADKDLIHAVIKGTAINHDGKTFGYSVPNPVAQTEVIKDAINKAKINPRTISYVEAHGTGTNLGDPIEIQGLNDAYSAYTTDKQYCAIGSVKSNIGHPEAAAGIAQLTKVILQMKHKVLVPNLLHSERTNPNIDFENTPFYVQRTVEEWKAPVITNEGDVQILPRRAGISSFGVGGVNAHIIVEEYQNQSQNMNLKENDEYPVVIVLSAKKESNLRAYAKQMKEYFIQSQDETATLRNIAYTLQVGRDPMAYRLAFTANQIGEVVSKLDVFLNDMKIDEESVIFFGTPSSQEDIIENDDEENSLNKVAKLWVKGKEIDWQNLYGNDLPRRISLPTYPFSKERYWIVEKIDKPQYNQTVSIIEAPERKKEDQALLFELCDSPEDERKEMIADYLQNMVSELLGFLPSNVPELYQGFFDMGMESVMVMKFQSLIEEKFKIKMSETSIFDHSNIIELSEYVASIISFDELENQNIPNKRNQEELSSITELGNVNLSNSSEVQLMDLEDVASELRILLEELKY
ncbi:hypothetical protein IEE_05224 [Bacillus cereus BAG5X1-1]|uniref:Carrier domain-containing protein n=1 Tax=Bacillus cereus BAG5X1-1 TaxID=1053189 RepID=J7WZT2_BACCE|nr:hypothetical protein IEE_05224 [Bacillus cereus BAG5X1-1]